MRFLKSVFLITLLPIASVAGDLTLKYGSGIGVDAKGLSGNVFDVALTFSNPLGSTFAYKLEGGYNIDGQPKPMRSSFPFGSLSMGLPIDLSPIYINWFEGIGFIGKTDSLLGGHMQFFHDLSVGVKDKQGRHFGIGLKHISSAGIYTPNKGRNYFNLEIGVTFK